MFTENTDRIFERLMLEKPGNNKNSRNRNSGAGSGFKYRYTDSACKYCLHDKGCNFEYCPEIIENLDDLVKDEDFINAIQNANLCKNGHRQTLIKLKERYWGAGI